MSDIIILRTKTMDKNLIYDCINDKLFLVGDDESDKFSFSKYSKAKGSFALVSLLCLPLLWITQYVNIPVLLLYLLAFYLKKHVRRIFIEPDIEKFKNMYWEPISHEQASQMVEDFSVIGYICFVLGTMTLVSVMYSHYDSLEVRNMGLVGVLFLGSAFLAIMDDVIISYKLIKKLKKMRTT